MFASFARFITCTIIGKPPIRARGLLGKRVDASRAGIIIIGFVIFMVEYIVFRYYKGK
jgi:hypothetical protein